MLPIIPSSITAQVYSTTSQARPTTSKLDSNNSLPKLLNRILIPLSILLELPRRNRRGRSRRKYGIRLSLNSRRLNYLDAILESLRNYYQSAKNFIEILVLARKRAITVFLRDLYKDQELVEALRFGRIVLQNKLKAVRYLLLFYQYSDRNIRILDKLTKPSIYQSITNTALYLVELLNILYILIRELTREITTTRLVSLLGIIYFTQRPNTCDNL